MTLHAGLDTPGGGDFLAVGRDGAVDPAVFGGGGFGVEFEDDEQAGLLCRLVALAILAGGVGPEVIALPGGAFPVAGRRDDHLLARNADLAAGHFLGDPALLDDD